jgi:glutamine synthetase
MDNNVQSWLEDHSIGSVRVEATNLDSSLIGKVLSPGKFISGITGGYNFADLAFGVDLGNTPHWGFAWPKWRGDMADISLRPDPDTLVEWGPGRAAVIGDFYQGNGEPLPVCPRNTLKGLCEKLAEFGYTAKVAVEIEATVFEESILEARRRGFRNLTPLGGTSGFAYHLPKDNLWHEYMSAVSRRLTELEIPWEAWNDEAASGQIELNIAIADPIKACDYWTRARQVMREVAFDLGRTITFMSKWSDEYGQASHINLSLERDGKNAFYSPDGPSDVQLKFIGGVMQTMEASTALAFPWITSYRRLVDLDGPPTTLTWGIANKSTAIRAVDRHPKQSRIEYRLPGSDANVYLVLAGLLASGLAGLKNDITPPEPFKGMAYCLPPGTVTRIPNTLGKALKALSEDTILRENLGAELVDYWIGLRRWEWMQFHSQGGDPGPEITDWEFERYFELA